RARRSPRIPRHARTARGCTWRRWGLLGVAALGLPSRRRRSDVRRGKAVLPTESRFLRRAVAASSHPPPLSRVFGHLPVSPGDLRPGPIGARGLLVSPLREGPRGVLRSFAVSPWEGGPPCATA